MGPVMIGHPDKQSKITTSNTINNDDNNDLRADDTFWLEKCLVKKPGGRGRCRENTLIFLMLPGQVDEEPSLDLQDQSHLDLQVQCLDKNQSGQPASQPPLEDVYTRQTVFFVFFCNSLILNK